MSVFWISLEETSINPVHAVQKEGLAPEARRRRARGRDHGPHRPQRRLARDGRHERAAGDGGKGAVARDGARWLKRVGRDWSISADYIWLN